MAYFDILAGLNLTRGANQTLSGVTPNNSALIDMQGWEGLAVWLNTGTVTVAGTAGFTMKLQHSDSTAAGTFVDVPADQVSGTTSLTLDTDDDKLAPAGIRYNGSRRYVRAVITGTTNTNAIVNVWFLRGRPQTSAPVATVGATTAAT
jgi:hypothetical protein